jgi:hypothetical protein
MWDQYLGMGSERQIVTETQVVEIAGGRVAFQRLTGTPVSYRTTCNNEGYVKIGVLFNEATLLRHGQNYSVVGTKTQIAEVMDRLEAGCSGLMKWQHKRSEALQQSRMALQANRERIRIRWAINP